MNLFISKYNSFDLMSIKFRRDLKRLNYELKYKITNEG